ncbi:TetR/AcrR family transcriptional regulator [Actinomadura fibrosa]|uniref:TetR/AcrR family transcriptional regulator n=1 Tax=Actinomadura fibrosa TaxID=111802 RepID=A0ABW2XD78_9ACTN|nr:TetR/AcrR family transcriptional regulator [Actinomadura fibrosa]
MSDPAEVPAPRRGRDRKAPDERRGQILACARALLSERPYGSVSNTDIAAAAGVSRGLLNHYFGTKRELYLAAVADMMAVPPAPVPAFAEGATVRERVGQSIEAWLELLHRNRATWITALDMTASRGDAELEKILDEARERAVDHMAEVVGLAPASRERSELWAAFRGFSGMAEATTREWLKYERLTRAQVRLILEEVLLHLLDEIVPRLAHDTAGE